MTEQAAPMDLMNSQSHHGPPPSSFSLIPFSRGELKHTHSESQRLSSFDGRLHDRISGKQETGQCKKQPCSGADRALA